MSIQSAAERAWERMSEASHDEAKVAIIAEEFSPYQELEDAVASTLDDYLDPHEWSDKKRMELNGRRLREALEKVRS